MTRRVTVEVWEAEPRSPTEDIDVGREGKKPRELGAFRIEEAEAWSVEGDLTRPKLFRRSDEELIRYKAELKLPKASLCAPFTAIIDRQGLKRACLIEDERVGIAEDWVLCTALVFKGERAIARRDASLWRERAPRSRRY